MDLGYRLLAAKYLRRQARQLALQVDGVRAAVDIEYVHRARVATRRLRAALEMFDDCFPAKRVKRWRKAIRRTTASLGDARDRDVQLEFLCGVLAELDAKECVPGVAAVMVRWEHDRRRLQPKVVKTMDRLLAKGILQEVRRRTKIVLRKSAAAEKSPQTPQTLARAGRHILRLTEELLALQNCLTDPNDRERHHAMRIAVKRLRYTLEIIQPLYSGRLEESVKAIKRLQTLLGDVHDCDVWLDHLDGFASAERKRTIATVGRADRFQRLSPGVDYLREDRRRRRGQVFEELVGYWAELAGRRFWEELKSLAKG